MTLLEDKNINIPGWNKVDFLLKKYPNIKLLQGVEKKGDLYKEKNLKYNGKFFRKYGYNYWRWWF